MFWNHFAPRPTTKQEEEEEEEENEAEPQVKRQLYFPVKCLKL